MTNRTCPKCRIRERGTQAYCKECSREYKAARRRAKIQPRDCIICGDEYRSPYPHTLTCSPGCGRERERRLLGQSALPSQPLTCSVCATEFMARNSTHKFCCKRCTMVANAKQNATPRVLLTEAQRAENLRLSQRRWEDRNPNRIKYRGNTPSRRAAVLRRRARRESVMSLPFTTRELTEKFDYWGGRCWMCEASATSMDHVKPIMANGPHILANLRPACGSCNSSKGGRWFGVSGLHRFIKT